MSSQCVYSRVPDCLGTRFYVAHVPFVLLVALYWAAYKNICLLLTSWIQFKIENSQDVQFWLSPAVLRRYSVSY